MHSGALWSFPSSMCYSLACHSSVPQQRSVSAVPLGCGFPPHLAQPWSSQVHQHVLFSSPGRSLESTVLVPRQPSVHQGALSNGLFTETLAKHILRRSMATCFCWLWNMSCHEQAGTNRMTGWLNDSISMRIVFNVTSVFLYTVHTHLRLDIVLCMLFLGYM